MSIPIGQLAELAYNGNRQAWEALHTRIKDAAINWLAVSKYDRDMINRAMDRNMAIQRYEEKSDG
jgi:hypothetical protein